MAKPSNIKNATTFERHKSQVDGDSTINRRRMLTMTTALAIANTSPAFAFPRIWQDSELIELGQQLETVSAQWEKSSESVSRLAEVAENQ